VSERSFPLYEMVVDKEDNSSSAMACLLQPIQYHTILDLLYLAPGFY